MPRPPPDELNNKVVADTIASNPSLFTIVTPINVDRFEELLVTHPNRPFVESVCWGLRHGFWPPGGDTHSGIYPETHDASLPTPLAKERADFMETQCQIEVDSGRFSHSFGSSLLPGMYCMPVYAVPKPDSEDLRLITDHSASSFSLNSMIPRNEHPSYPLDNLHSLGEILISAQGKDRAQNLILFKSDVSIAYRLMPMHPFWQVKQAVRVGGLLYIDRCGVIGGRRSGDYSVSFHSLVTWIAREIKDITDLLVYSDDFFGINEATDFTFYPPYNQHLPSRQYRLLLLWDELGIPHKMKKQISGSPLNIIGIEVDPNHLTYTLSSAARQSLIDELLKFCQK